MINKLLVLGKEIGLPVEMDDVEISDKTKFISVLSDLDPELASELEAQEYAIRVEGNAVVAYRTSAVLG